MRSSSPSLPASRLGWLAPALTLGTLTLGTLALTASAQAQATQYNSQASFNAATSGVTTFNFNGYAPKNIQQYYLTGLTVDGVTFNAIDGVFVVDPGFGTGNPFSGSQYLDNPASSGPLSVALPAGTTAFGADFANYFSSSQATITALVNGQSFTFAAPGSFSNSSVFAGFTSTVPITSLSFSDGFGVVLDNVSIGSAIPAAVPEASTTVSFGLLALGLAGVVVAAKKKAVA